MSVFVIIAVVCLVALAWFWRKTPGLKRTPPRTWSAPRRKTGPKRKFTVPF